MINSYHRIGGDLLDFSDIVFPVVVSLPYEEGGALADHDPADAADRLGDEGQMGAVPRVGVTLCKLSNLFDLDGLQSRRKERNL